MTKTSRLSVQQKVDVIPEADGERYKSQIQDLDSDTVSISIPVRCGQYLLLQEGESVRVEFPVNDAVFAFTSQVLGRKKSNHVPLIILSRPTVFTRRQRRDFFRLSVLLPVQLTVLPQSAAGMGEIQTVSGKTVDISGGGLQLICSAKLEKGNLVHIALRLEDGNQPLSLTGQVCWTVEDEITRTHRVGVSFQDIREADRENIISYIFNRMRQRTPS